MSQVDGFEVVAELPGNARNTGGGVWSKATVAADKVPGQWVKAKTCSGPAYASNVAHQGRKRYPGYEFAARGGVVYVRRPVPAA